MSIKKDIILVLATAALTSGILYACNSGSSEKTGQDSATNRQQTKQTADGNSSSDSTTKGSLLSMRLTWPEAKGLKNAYTRFTGGNNRQIMDLPPGANSPNVLNGFVFDADHLQEILTRNHSMHGQEANKVIFFFGKDTTRNGDFPQGGQRHPKLHFVAVGIKQGTDDQGKPVYRLMNDHRGLTITDGKSAMYSNASVFDKAESAPPFLFDETKEQ